MHPDPWLPLGTIVGPDVTSGRLIYDGVSAQLYATLGGGRALVASEALGGEWIRLGLVAEQAISRCTLGQDQYLVIASQEHVLAPLAECSRPTSLSEALAFVGALRRTRGMIVTEHGLEDSIYCEAHSVLLPLAAEQSGVPDDVVIGRYLTGGVSVSCRSIRRLRNLLPQVPEGDLLRVAAAAGVKTSSGEGGISSTASYAAFSLPGRPELETFFREHVVDIVQNSERYRALGVEFPSAVVLQGPPGCGKTFAVERLIEYLGS